MNNVPESGPSQPAPAAPGALPDVGFVEFEMLRVVGQGGFSVVYKAQDHSLGRPVAIKEYLPSAIAVRLPGGMVAPKLPEHQPAFTAGLNGFIREARLLAQFAHPALVTVYRIWENNGTAYLAMRYCEGKTLPQIRQTEPDKVRDEGWLKATFGPILDALELLHAQNCLHRDISPDNILMLDSGGPILLDFGAARQIVGDMTQALTVVLKPGFAPLEQYADDASVQQGPWTDVYGVGAVLYYLLTGRPPVAAVARAVKDPMGKLADADELAGVSLSFRQTIDRALAVQYGERIQSIAELREALQLFAPQPVRAPGQAQAHPPGATGQTAHGLAQPVALPDGPAPAQQEEPPPGKDPLATETAPALPMPVFHLGRAGQEEEPSETTPPPPPLNRPTRGVPLPPALEKLEERLLAHARQGVALAAQAAQALQRHAGPALKRIGQPSTDRNRVLGLGAAAVVAAGVLVGVWGLLHTPAAPENHRRMPSSVIALAPPPADAPAAHPETREQPPVGALHATPLPAAPEVRIAAAPAVSPAAAPDISPDISPDLSKESAGQQPAPPPPETYGGPPPTEPVPDSVNQTANVHLSIKPWGEIAVDGQSVGASPPIASLSLHPGEHLLMITNGSFNPVFVPVVVPEGEDIAVSYEFE